MSKINRGYQSLFEYLADRDFPLMRWIDQTLYADEVKRLKNPSMPYGRRWNPKPYDDNQQIIGSFQPLADMLKDTVDTFKPYKSAYQIKQDFRQPIRGLGNIVRGVANLVGAPLVFIGNTFRYLFFSHSLQDFSYNMRLNFLRSSSWLLDGISSLIRGITQIATTPLTWLIKMPLRGLITLFKGRPNFENGSGVRRLIREGNEAINDRSGVRMAGIRYELHRKFQRAIQQKQKKGISREQEQKLFHAEGSSFDDEGFKYIDWYLFGMSMDNEKAARSYLALFNLNKQLQDFSEDGKEKYPKISKIDWDAKKQNLAP